MVFPTAWHLSFGNAKQQMSQLSVKSVAPNGISPGLRTQLQFFVYAAFQG